MLRLQPLVLCTLLIGLALPSSVWAAKDPVYAVLIGINRYKDRSISRLKYTGKDVRGIYKTLTGIGRVPKKNVRILLNRQATKYAISKTLRSWLYKKMRRSRGKATAIIYFSGHGWSGGNLSYWLAYDSSAKSPKHIARTAIDHESVDSWLTRLRSKRVVLFIDACNSGFAWSGTRSIGMAQKGFHKSINATQFGQGRVTIASSMQNQYSVESNKIRHGVFSYVLIEALKGKADYNKDGIVTLPEVWTHLSQNVRTLAMKLKKYPQSPVRSGPSTGAIPISFPAVRAFVAHRKHKQPTGSISSMRGLRTVQKDNLKITSSPKGARLFVDGADSGTTPLTLHLPQGIHRLRITKRGFSVWRGKVYTKHNRLLHKHVRLRAKRTQQLVPMRDFCIAAFYFVMKCKGEELSFDQLNATQKSAYLRTCSKEQRRDGLRLTKRCVKCVFSHGCIKDEAIRRLCRKQCYE